MQSSDRALQDYAARLFKRRDQAAVLNWADVAIGAWRPYPHECHHNVMQVCANNPDCKPAHGWLYFDLLATSGYAKFVAHSVVSSNGKMFEVTPPRDLHRQPFLVAEESEDQYALLVGRGIIELFHCP